METNSNAPLAPEAREKFYQIGHILVGLANQQRYVCRRNISCVYGLHFTSLSMHLLCHLTTSSLSSLHISVLQMHPLCIIKPVFCTDETSLVSHTVPVTNASLVHSHTIFSIDETSLVFHTTLKHYIHNFQ